MVIYLVGSSGLEPPTSRLSGVRSNHLSYEPVFGGDEEDRTPDPLLAKQVLSQLSYTPTWLDYSSELSKLNSYHNFPLLLPTIGTVHVFHELLLRKEVIQPHLPIRLPCYDFTLIINPTFDCCLLAVSSQASGVTDSHGVTGGVYKARERIHRGILIRDY